MERRKNGARVVEQPAGAALDPAENNKHGVEESARRGLPAVNGMDGLDNAGREVLRDPIPVIPSRFNGRNPKTAESHARIRMRLARNALAAP